MYNCLYINQTVISKPLNLKTGNIKKPIENEEDKKLHMPNNATPLPSSSAEYLHDGLIRDLEPSTGYA